MTKVIGVSISEAIDWAQDTLCSTRPIAEEVLFSMLADHKVTEGNDGFVLHEVENEGEKEIKRRRASHRPRFNFSHRRKSIAERRSLFQSQLKAMGYTDDDMTNLRKSATARRHHFLTNWLV